MVRRRGKRKYKYLATYVGKNKNIKYSGVGRVIPGETYEVSESIAKTFSHDPNWSVKKTYSYVYDE